MNLLQMMIVQSRIIREQCRKHALDRKAAAHCAVIIPARLERNQQVHNVVPYIQKMFRKVRNLYTFLNLLLDAGVFKHSLCLLSRLCHSYPCHLRPRLLRLQPFPLPLFIRPCLRSAFFQLLRMLRKVSFLLLPSFAVSLFSCELWFWWLCRFRWLWSSII